MSKGFDPREHRLAATELANPSTADLDSLDTRSLLRRIYDEDKRAVTAVEEAIDAVAAAVDAACERVRRGGTMHYFGAGTSGRLAVSDAAELPPTFSVDASAAVGHIAGGAAALLRAVEESEDDAGAGRGEVASAGVGKVDVAIGVSASGSTPFVLGAIDAAKSVGALTIGITNVEDSPLAGAVDHPIVLRTGPEAISGSTRMKAATAQKIALTSLSTAIMVKLGKVYGNLMVDLRATNNKLRARAVRLTREISGADEAAAREALEASDHRVKIAVVMLVKRCDAAEAERILSSASGSLRNVLG